jgi:hypothetical protein
MHTYMHTYMNTGSIPIINREKEITLKQLRAWVLSLLHEQCAATGSSGNGSSGGDDSDAENARWKSLEAMMMEERKLDGADEEEECSHYWDDLNLSNTSSPKQTM